MKKKYELLLKKILNIIGLSYRLSADKAIYELEKFLYKLNEYGIFENNERCFCFAALNSTLNEVRRLELDKKFNLTLIGSDKSAFRTILNTLDYFNVYSNKKRNEIIEKILKEYEPKKLMC